MKRYATYDFITKEFDRIVEVNDAVTMLAASFTEVLPPRALLKSHEAKKIKLIFDDKSNKWKSEIVDNTPSEVDFEEARNQIDHFVRVKLRSGFYFQGKLFSTIDSKQHEYNEIFISVLLGITEFPLNVKGIGDNYVTLKSADDLKSFITTMKKSKEQIRTAGRILKYGGSFNGHERSPIASFSKEELDAFDPEKALDDLLTAEPQQNVEA